MDEPYVLASEASQVFNVEDKKDKDWFVVFKTKARDVFDAGNGHLCGDDDTDTYCQNVPYYITADNEVSNNIGLIQANVKGTTLDAMIIAKKYLQEGDFIDDNDFIDDEVSNEDYSDNEYNDNQQCNVLTLSFELLCSCYNTSNQNMHFDCHLSCVLTYVNENSIDSHMCGLVMCLLCAIV